MNLAELSLYLNINIHPSMSQEIINILDLIS